MISYQTQKCRKHSSSTSSTSSRAEWGEAKIEDESWVSVNLAARLGRRYYFQRRQSPGRQGRQCSMPAVARFSSPGDGGKFGSNILRRKKYYSTLVGVGVHRQAGDTSIFRVGSSRRLCDREKYHLVMVMFYFVRRFKATSRGGCLATQWGIPRLY